MSTTPIDAGVDALPVVVETAAAGRRARNRLERERAYLAAAMDIAGRDGLRALTMQRLADEVDAAVGTVYTYFPAKGALVAELQREAIERLTESYHLIRDRSDAVLSGWDDPAAASVARLAVFGRFWVASVDTFPQEAAFLHALISESGQTVPPEEHYRVLPAALTLLDEASGAVVEGRELRAITHLDGDDPMDLVIRWAAALTGVLLTSNLAPLNPKAFDGRRLARILQSDLLRGWGASPERVARAEQHVAALEAGGPLAPPLDP
ncbi:MAG: Transcriptional regulator, TetR family protein [Acidimicrobiales bacterium]|nr:Transcriptional regulator, TetR family protein [Acidimicrobiales bacterium]